MNRLRHTFDSSKRVAQAGMTLVEVVLALGLMSIMMVAFYAGFAYAFSEIRLSQENVRATQILQEKMELVRLLTWDQVANLPNYVPSTFNDSFYVENPTNSETANVMYSGKVIVTNASLSENYAGDLKLVTVQVNWLSGKVKRTREMSTFVSQYGLQKYVY